MAMSEMSSIKFDPWIPGTTIAQIMCELVTRLFLVVKFHFNTNVCTIVVKPDQHFYGRTNLNMSRLHI